MPLIGEERFYFHAFLANPFIFRVMVVSKRSLIFIMVCRLPKPKSRTDIQFHVSGVPFNLDRVRIWDSGFSYIFVL